MEEASVMANAAEGPGAQRQVREFLRALAADGGTSIDHLTPAQARAVLVGLQVKAAVDLPAADVTQRIVGSDGQTIRLVVVRPAGVSGALPAFMFFHGGG
jgi:acetyl esterase/lipase